MKNIKSKALSLAVILMFAFSALPVQGIVANPSLGGTCGLDIALVVDRSGSIGNTNLNSMENDFKDFVTALSVTPTIFSVTSFAGTATVNQSFTNVVADIHDALDFSSSGATNWEDGLLKAQSTFAGGRSDKPNLVVFASDGNPTVNNDSSATGGTTDGNDLSNAVAVADTIKGGNILTDGARIVTIGIGSGPSQANLEAISSADAYFSAANFDDLQAELDEIITDLCGGTLTITKVVNDEPAEAGWVFEVGGDEYVTDDDGQVNIPLSNDSYSVIETDGPVDNYTFQSASCDGASNNGSPTENGVSGVVMGTDDIISCTFYNSVPVEVPGCMDPHALNYNPHATVDDQSCEYPPTTITIVKQTEGGYGTFEFEGINEGFDLTTTEGNNPDSETFEELTPGIDYTISESALSGWDLTSKDCQGTNWNNQWSQNSDGSISVNLQAGSNVTCTFTNTKQGDADTSTISGMKWNDVNSDRQNDEESGIAGWSINLFSYSFDSDVIVIEETPEATTTTDSSGNYSFVNLDPDLNYIVCEVLESGWEQTSPTLLSDGTVACANGTVGYGAQSGDGADDFTFKDFGNHEILPPPQTTYQCSDGLDNESDSEIDEADPGCHTDEDANNPNSYDPNDDDETDSGDIPSGGGGSSGSRSSRSSGQVLGAETSVCSFAIDTYMRRGYRNNNEQVKILQALLNKYTGGNLVIDGLFGPLTEGGVNAFQIKYRENILIPWGLTSPTGIFYKTTLVQAKNLECPATILPIPTDLVNWSRNPGQVPAHI